jgi:hypothetical protein
MRTLFLFLLLTALAATPPAHAAAPAAPAAAAVPAGDAIVSTFEQETPTGELRASNATVTSAQGDAAEGERYVRLTPSRPEANVAQLRLALPRGASAAASAGLTAAVRAPGATGKIELRWYALDAKNRPLFQRRFELEPGERWVRLDEPLRAWRWDNARVGDWDEVTSLGLVVATPSVGRVDLDDVRFTGVADEKQNVEWLLTLAFTDRPRKVAHADGLLVATDAADAFAQKDFDRLLDGMRRTRAWLRKTFGEAVRPTDDHHAPAALLIFAAAADYPAFYQRLGDAWRVTIGAPRSQGYTVQDVATSTFDAKLGPDRPVYFHEAAHAVVARDLRLLAGHDAHRAMQEAIANYLQVCRYPQSLPRGAYVKQFAQPIDPTGKGFFKPLETLFTKTVTVREYAQLASVVAFLVEQNPRLLRELARGMADGESAGDVLARTGTTWRHLENAWLAWGRQRFSADVAADKDAPAFKPPAEFR